MKLFQTARYSKGQLKIQEMAFVLVAIFILFSLVALLYFSIRFSGLRDSAEQLREQEAREIVRGLSKTPEFAWPGCENCIDLDKVLIVKERANYKGFWDLDYLKIEKVYPAGRDECSKANYPDCNGITIVNKTSNIGSPAWAFVSLCRNELNEGYTKCELGRIYASGREVE